MAKPAKPSAKQGRDADAIGVGGGSAGRQRPSPLLLGLIGLGSVQALAIAGTLIWLALGADETADRLVQEAEEQTRQTAAETGAVPSGVTPAPSDRTDRLPGAPTAPAPADTGSGALASAALTPSDPADPRSAAPSGPSTEPIDPMADPAETPAPADGVSGDGRSDRAPTETVQPADEETAVPGLPPRPVDPPVQLATAPFADLIEPGPDGPLPVRGSDGLTPWQAYARPYPAADPRPRIAIVVAGLGQSAAMTRRTIEQLPGTVTLAFDPYSPTTSGWLEIARDDGHESVLETPMEPLDSGAIDPGPWALMTGLDPSDNRARLYQVLARGAGYVGLMPRDGDRFLTAPAARVPLLEEVADRGLMLLSPADIAAEGLAQAANAAGAPLAVIDAYVDAVPTRSAIELGLARLEEVAVLTGAAVGVINPYPISLDQLEQWAAMLPDRGIALVPLSATVGR